MSQSYRIIVSGLVGWQPLGGVAWDYLQYVLGLADLGHDVYYHEDTWSWPFDPVRNEFTDRPDYSVAFLRSFFREFAPNLSDRWHYRHLHEQSYGMSWQDFSRKAATTDIFLNVSGACLIPGELNAKACRIFLDTDPGYNQIVLATRPPWAENKQRWSDLFHAHDQHFTYAENIHGPDCRVPKLGIDWKTTRMPVVPALWDFDSARTPGSAWTTVMTWSAFPGPLVLEGKEYHSKGTEFEKIISLPGTLDLAFELAVGGKTAPLERLQNHGWRVRAAPEISRTPGDYRDYLAGSRGEISTAKQVYVALRTGWFSCRSACYLAAGRPAVVQDTGFPPELHRAAGLLRFSCLEEARENILQIEADYEAHSQAARSLAREQFAAPRVLAEMLAQL